MKIIFAKHIGFCAGVKRALNIAKSSLKNDPKPVYFLGPLIHNELVIEKIEKLGGKVVDDFKKIKNGTLVLRAHGEILPEKFLSETKIKIKDATCPLVKKAQNSALYLKKLGYQVVIIGDLNHPEVEGIKKAVQEEAILIQNPEEAKKLPKMEKIGVVSQTTQELENVESILKILKKKTKNLKFIDTLCPEVKARQKELKEIFKKADGILVIGSKTSANTKRLVFLSQKAKKKVWWANSLKEVKEIDFKGIKKLGVISGTSAPDWEIKKIKNYLFKKYGSN
jgi:4-hydroxy-3-methylbut-2-enyl diphosphate reductase